MPSQKEYLAVQDFYAEPFAWCFGCGRLNPHGHHFRTRWDGDTTLTEYTPGADQTALPGFVYGGFLASLIDCHSTGSAALALYRRDGHELGDDAPTPRCVTASLNVQYHKPTPLGPKLSVRGRIVELGERKVVVQSDLYAKEVITVSATVVAVATRDSHPTD